MGILKPKQTVSFNLQLSSDSKANSKLRLLVLDLLYEPEVAPLSPVTRAVSPSVNFSVEEADDGDFRMRTVAPSSRSALPGGSIPTNSPGSLEVKVLAAKGLQSTGSPRSLHVQIRIGRWTEATPTVRTLRVPIWNSVMRAGLGEVGPATLLQAQVRDTTTDMPVGSGQFQLADLDWQREVHMITLQLGAGDSPVGSLSLIARALDPQGVRDWVQGLRRFSTVGPQPGPVMDDWSLERPPALGGSTPLIPAAEELPASPIFALLPPPRVRLTVKVLSSKGLFHPFGVFRPFAEVEAPLAKFRAVTQACEDNPTEPIWNEAFDIEFPPDSDRGYFEIRIRNGDQERALLGLAYLDLNTVTTFASRLTLPMHDRNTGSVEVVAQQHAMNDSSGDLAFADRSYTRIAQELEDRPRAGRSEAIGPTSSRQPQSPGPLSQHSVLNESAHSLAFTPLENVPAGAAAGTVAITSIQLMVLSAQAGLLDGHPPAELFVLATLSGGPGEPQQQRQCLPRRSAYQVHWPDLLEFDLLPSAPKLFFSVYVARGAEQELVGTASCPVVCHNGEEVVSLTVVAANQMSLLQRATLEVQYTVRYEGPKQAHAPSRTRIPPRPEARAPEIYDIKAPPPPPTYVDVAMHKEAISRVAQALAPVVAIIWQQVRAQPAIAGALLFVLLLVCLFSWFFQLFLLILLGCFAVGFKMQQESKPKDPEKVRAEMAAADPLMAMSPEEVARLTPERRKQLQLQHEEAEKRQEAAKKAAQELLMLVQISRAGIEHILLRCSAVFAQFAELPLFRDEIRSRGTFAAIATLFFVSLVIPLWFFALVGVLALSGLVMPLDSEALAKDPILPKKAAIVVAVLCTTLSILFPVWLVVAVSVGYLVAFGYVPAVRNIPDSKVLAGIFSSAGSAFVPPSHVFRAICKAKALEAVLAPGTPPLDAFVVFEFEGTTRNTEVSLNSVNPRWHEKWLEDFLVTRRPAFLKVQLWDNHNTLNGRADFLGEDVVTIRSSLREQDGVRWVVLRDRQGRPTGHQLCIGLEVRELAKDTVIRPPKQAKKAPPSAKPPPPAPKPAPPPKPQPKPTPPPPPITHPYFLDTCGVNPDHVPPAKQPHVHQLQQHPFQARSPYTSTDPRTLPQQSTVTVAEAYATQPPSVPPSGTIAFQYQPPLAAPLPGNRPRPVPQQYVPTPHVMGRQPVPHTYRYVDAQGTLQPNWQG
eukprot:TRINITY_DN3281_c0_g1_i1.p1 TRINITY_DN3281_c0_g1~~TRINITY_DN3281_c0_g1_i1.p1  ORF type:complete len:1306 (+),score=192.66 TRINITY_DN3281_c0_g1_i1:301-3918(+)